MKHTNVVLLDGSHSFIVYEVKRKYAHAVAMNSLIKLVKIELPHQLKPAMRKGKPYSVKRAVRIYLASGLPRTDKATTVLRRLEREQREAHQQAA